MNPSIIVHIKQRKWKLRQQMQHVQLLVTIVKQEINFSWDIN